MNEEKIYIEVCKGRSLRDVASEFGVSKNKVDYIKKNGDYYVDITSVNDVKKNVFSAKRPSEKEQLCYIIISYNELWLKNQTRLRNIAHTSKNKLADKKSIKSKLAIYLEVNRSTITRWCNPKKKKLVKEEIWKLYDNIINEFYSKEDEIMGKTFYIDDEGAVKGYKLYCIDYWSNPKLAYHINNHARAFYKSRMTPKAFEKAQLEYYYRLKEQSEEEISESLNYVVRLSIVCGIGLAIWMFRMAKLGYKYDEICDCIEDCQLKFDDSVWYDGELSPPRFLYYETKGILFVPENLKPVMKEMWEDGRISGVFQQVA